MPADVLAFSTTLLPTIAGFGETVNVVAVVALVGVPVPPPDPEAAPLQPQIRLNAEMERKETRATDRIAIETHRAGIISC